MNPSHPPSIRGRQDAVDRPFIRSAILLAVGLVMLSAPAPASAQVVSQTFTLRTGWNAIWLDLQPTNPAVTAVFAGAPLVSVWTYASREAAVDFIEDPNEPVWNRARWLVHVPTNRVESFQNNLFALSAKRAYLVQLTNAFTLAVTGRPVWRNRNWAPDAYTLRGLPVDPADAPDFNTFFGPSRAHYDSATGRLQKIFRLNQLGQWALVSPGDRVNYGEAYWIYTQGTSDFIAPVSAQVDAGDALDFGTSAATVVLGVANHTSDPVTVRLRDAATPSPLSYQRFNPTNAVEWAPFPATLTNSIEPAAGQRLRLAIRRNDLSTDQYASILEIKDGRGTRLQLAVSALKLINQQSGGGSGPNPAPAPSLSGLWIGNASINAVNELNSLGDASTPTRTWNAFSLRLILHVDSSGATRLLKEVVQLWENGTTTTDSGGLVLDTPGHFVLATEERLFPQWHGTTLRDGTPAGRRISTVGFDFPSASEGNVLRLTGTFGGNSALSASITLRPQFPTNPFRHKFHPDHDNLDARFASYKPEAYEVLREISLQFTNVAPSGVSAVDYGYRVQAGTYRERVTGLNKNPINCQGTFSLTRVSEVGLLNQ